MKISPDSIIVSKGKSVKILEAHCFQLCLVTKSYFTKKSCWLLEGSGCDKDFSVNDTGFGCYDGIKSTFIHRPTYSVVCPNKQY